MQQFRRCKKLKDNACHHDNLVQDEPWFFRRTSYIFTHLLSIRQANVMAVELDAIFMHHSSNELSIEGKSRIVEGGRHDVGWRQLAST